MASTIAADILKHRGGLSCNSLVNILSDMENVDDTVVRCADSPYIEMSDAMSYLKQFSDKFVVLDVNIQSLNAKFDTFTLFLEDLSSNDFYFFCDMYSGKLD